MNKETEKFPSILQSAEDERRQERNRNSMTKQDQYKAKTEAFDAWKALSHLRADDPERVAAREAYEAAKAAFEAPLPGAKTERTRTFVGMIKRNRRKRPFSWT